MIYQKLMESASSLMNGLKVEDVRVGIGYTAVKNSAGGLGLAYTLREDLECGCSHIPDAGSLGGRDLAEVASYFSCRNNVIKTAIGLAAINSVAPGGNGSGLSGDVLKVLDIRPDEWVGMIGHFAPIEKKIRQVTPHLFVIDRGKGYLRGNEFRVIQEILSSCKVLIITATALLNRTLEDILQAGSRARTRVLLGPSTPLYPDVFSGHVEVLSGMVPGDKDHILQIVGQGGGTLHFGRHSHKVNILLKGNKNK